MSSNNSINRLSKAKHLLAQFEAQQLQSENYIEIRINLKGLKYMENPDNGQKLTFCEVVKCKFNDKVNQKIYSCSTGLQQDPFIKLVVRNSATMTQIYTVVKNKLKKKFGQKNFQNQSLHLYCKGSLISGGQNLMKIKDIVEKYNTNQLTCQRMEAFG